MKRILSGVLVLFVLCGAAPQTDLAWDKYNSEQRKLQVAIHHLIRLNWQHLREVVDKSLELQLLLAEERNDRFYFLIGSSPGNIIRDKGFQAFVNFPWSLQDMDRILSEDSGYKKKMEKIEKLKKEVLEHPDYAEMEERLAGLQKEREYLEVLARFRFVSEEVEELLAGPHRPKY